MVEAKRGQEPPHPEGLTQVQERLAHLLFDTKTQAKVRRRVVLPDGQYQFNEIVRPTSPIDFAQSGEFALKLHERLPHAPLSPIYINLRNLPEEVLDGVGQSMAEIPSTKTPDFCTGIPNAGTPLAQAYSRHSGLEYVDIFGKEETSEGRRITAGTKDYKGGEVRLIDDLVTQADTKLEAIKAAESLGLTVTDIFVLVDREQGGKQQLQKQGHDLQSIFTLKQMLEFYLRTGKINPQTYNETVQGLQALNKFLGI